MAKMASRMPRGRRLARRALLAGAAWAALSAAQTLAWCGRNDEGDCFIAIRTGGEPAAARGHARGVKFVHEDTGTAGLEETFGYVAAFPNEGAAAAELRFAVGDDARASLLGSGAFQVDRLEVGGALEDQDPAGSGDAVALRVSRGGLQIVNADRASLLSVDGPGSARASLVVDRDAATLNASVPLAVSAARIRLQNAVFEQDAESHNSSEAATRLTVGSLVATSGKAVLGAGGAATPAGEQSRLELRSAAGSWAVENSADSGFGILQGAQRVVKIAHEAPRDALVVDADGNVGLGTRWPSVKLDVNGGVQGTSAYSSASDRRWKTQIADLSSNLARVRALRPVSFEFRHEAFPEKSFDRGMQIGFIAQEVEQVVPEVVRTDAQGMKSVQYASLAPVLAGALKELEAEVAALRVQVAALRAERGSARGPESDERR